MIENFQHISNLNNYSLIYISNRINAMLFEWFLRHFWQFTAKQGLLDEQDIILLEESFSDGDACCIWSAMELGALIIPSIAFLVNYGFLLSTFLIVFTLMLIPCFLFYTIPNFVCWFLTSKVDERFRDFLACLRQKELCVFSLQRFSHCSISNGFLLPLRRSRLNCLNQLRTFIKHFNLASKQLIITVEDGENLLFNFIGEEMRTLAINEKYDENDTTEEDESKLQTSALKTLWQCMFLVRSEFLRLSLLALHHDILHANPISFIRHFFLIFRTLLATALLNVSTNKWEPDKMKTLLHSTSVGAQNKITRIKICRAQLEWAMERMELLDEKSTKKFKEEEVLIVSAIVECLRQIIRMMETEKDGGKTKSPTENCETNELGKRINDEENADLDSERMEEEKSMDFQIFEADLAKQNTKTKTNFDEEMEISSPVSSLFSPFGVHNAVQNELKQALCLRKDFCLQREMAALAQLRGISPEEIAKEELDRTPFSSDIFERPMKMETTSPPQITHGPFGRASLNSADLNSILARRREIFGANETMVQHNHRVMEEFVDNDSEDEEQKNELKNNR